MLNNKSHVLLALTLCIFAASSTAHAEEACFYQDKSGTVKQVRYKRQIPSEYRPYAKCLSLSPNSEPGSTKSAIGAAGNQHLAKPEEIDLDGTVRREKITSGIGTMELRWPRKVELLFGRTPLRAMADAARTVSRTLRQGGFPTKVENLNLKWQVVFMDEDLPETQIPSYLVSNCHPAWMTPPANIYVVAQRIVAGCGGAAPTKSAVADSQLGETLIHELGHAVEFYMIDNRLPPDRMRSEGFATWFERYGSKFSSIVDYQKVKRDHYAYARQSFQSRPEPMTDSSFGGSAFDYGRASMYFEVIENKRGAAGIPWLYELMVKKNLSLSEAVQNAMSWTESQLEQEMKSLVK